MAVEKASKFVDDMGVATHIDFTDGKYVEIERVLQSLDYLGIDSLRDKQPVKSGSDLDGQEHLGVAAREGFKFTFFAEFGRDPTEVVATLEEFEREHRGSIEMIGGPNEVNNFGGTYKGQSGDAGARLYMEDLYRLVNESPLLRNIPVSGLTTFPVSASASDYNGSHPYERQGDQPFDDLLGAYDAQNTADPGKPFIYSETGYHTSLTADTNGGWEGVDQLTQAKYIVNTYLGAARLGSDGTFIYELLNAYPGADNQETNFGLFNLDFSPKLAATAIHNMTAILADTSANAATFVTRDLDYSINGAATKVFDHLVQKSNGDYVLMASLGRDIWNESSDTPVDNPADVVAVSTGNRVFETINVIDPIDNRVITSFSNVSEFVVELDDHAYMIELLNEVDNLTLTGTVLNDSLTGGFDSDTIVGYAGNDTLVGRDGNDYVHGGAGDDFINAGNRQDCLRGSFGADTLTGGAGSDLFMFTYTEVDDANTTITGFSKVQGDKLLFPRMLGEGATFRGYNAAGVSNSVTAQEVNGRVDTLLRVFDDDGDNVLDHEIMLRGVTDAELTNASFVF